MQLSWETAVGAASYIVKRSTTSGSGYTNIATGVTATSYLDSGVVSGTTYYYVVAATNNFGVSPDSAEASATPLGPVPPPWQTQDIGAVGIAGSALYGNGVFSVTGAGGDIQGTADAFRFTYMTVSGDCTIIARVVSVQNIDPWSKAGVMIRASLDPGATNAFIAVTPGNGVTWQYRLTAGGGTSWNQTSGLNAPYWVKLVRSGTLFTGYRSPDGTAWTQQGKMTNSMTSTVYVGLALTSHNSSSLGTATFDNVTVQPGWPVAPAAPAGLTATAGDGSVALNWSASATATNYFVKRSTTSGSGYTSIATNASLAFTNHRPGQRHALLLRRQRRERFRRKHQLHSGQRASDIVRVCRHEYSQRSRTIANFLAGGSHGLAVAIANEQPHQRPRHELGQRARFGSDESDGGAVESDKRLGILPVGAAVLANGASTCELSAVVFLGAVAPVPGIRIGRLQLRRESPNQIDHYDTEPCKTERVGAGLFARDRAGANQIIVSCPRLLKVRSSRTGIR